MIEDAPTMEAESAIVLDGLAVGVDHLEAIVVYFAETGDPYAAWTRAGFETSASRVAAALLGVAELSRRVGSVLFARPDGTVDLPAFTLETGRRVTFVHRVRAFGIAIVFEREAPLGFARLACRRLVQTIESELPYPRAAAPAVPEGRATAPSGPPAPPDHFDAHEPAPDTQHHVRSTPVGERARALVRHVEATARDSHIARTRLALRSGLGLEALAHADTLSPDAILVLESAAEDILGVEPGRLAEIGRPAEGSSP